MNQAWSQADRAVGSIEVADTIVRDSFYLLTELLRTSQVLESTDFKEVRW